jgi:uncharacterized membrane protein (UPF0127 family)
MPVSGPPATPDQERKESSPATLAVMAAVLVFAAILRIQQAWSLHKVVLTQVSVGGTAFTAEVADSEAKRELGLGKRDSMPADRGMYFTFPAANYWVFWMKDMRFPIDIVWIYDGKVVDVTANAPVPKGVPLETFSPAAPADAVLELNAGTAAKKGISPGEDVVLRPVSS